MAHLSSIVIDTLTSNTYRYTTVCTNITNSRYLFSEKSKNCQEGGRRAVARVRSNVMQTIYGTTKLLHTYLRYLRKCYRPIKCCMYDTTEEQPLTTTVLQQKNERDMDHFGGRATVHS